MRVVFFIDHLRADGTQRFLRQLIAGLAERGHVLAIVCLNDSWDATVVGELQAAGAELRVVGQRALACVYGLITTLIWMRARRFDCAVTMLFVADVVARPLARAAAIPRLISSIRARNVNYAWWQRVLVRLTMPLTDQVVLNSANASDFAIAHEAVPASRMHIIPNGVLIGSSSELTQVIVRAEFGLPMDSRVLGSVGRLTYQKGFDVLLHALAQLAQRDIVLVLFGQGEDERSLRELAQELDIAEQVIFAGHRHDLLGLLGSLDIYIHPARFEGMPNALLEAMAAGRPIVATNVDGNRELIVDGIHGWLVPPNDPSALARAITIALENPAEAQRRGRAAQLRANQEFSVDVMVDAWEQVLRG